MHSCNSQNTKFASNYHAVHPGRIRGRPYLGCSKAWEIVVCWKHGLSYGRWRKVKVTS